MKDLKKIKKHLKTIKKQTKKILNPVEEKLEWMNCFELKVQFLIGLVMIISVIFMRSQLLEFFELKHEYERLHWEMTFDIIDALREEKEEEKDKGVEEVEPTDEKIKIEE